MEATFIFKVKAVEDFWSGDCRVPTEKRENRKITGTLCNCVDNNTHLFTGDIKFLIEPKMYPLFELKQEFTLTLKVKENNE